MAKYKERQTKKVPRSALPQQSGKLPIANSGHKVYLRAVLDAFGTDIDYAQLVKVYGNDYSGQHRYSPGVCTKCEQKPQIGKPDMGKISTSYVERANLTMRMSMRRFTRLTNAFSKKLENHAAAIALHFAFYNFCRPHQTLTKGAGFATTPAMAAGKADHVWTVEELVGLLSN